MEVTRAYLGYGYSYSESFSTRVTIDVSKPDIAVNGKVSDTITNSLQYTAHLKFAYGVYKYDRLSIAFGMIELNQFKLQDQFWGRRYIMKTIQDEYGFCSSADLGIKADYRFTDWFSADISMRNGEGFKKQQADNIYWYGGGFAVQPFTGFTYRTYFDFSKKVIVQTNFSNFINYSTNKFKVGAEVIVSSNNGYTVDKKLISYSALAAYQVAPKFELFGRYDNLSSNTLSGGANPWNYDTNADFAICGIQFCPMENIAIAVNGRYYLPENPTKDKKMSVYFNVDFKF